MDTIYALASAKGRSGVAVVRASGSQALEALQTLAGLENVKPRYAVFTPLRDVVSRETIDEALILYFKSPASYTGEDVVEYHCHGSAAVIDALSENLERLGHRMAEPGEFTRRAFENGKLDLTEAEAVADLIDAETAAQRRQALSQLGGGLSAIYQGWSDDLKAVLAHIEAEIEFPDEDLPMDLAENFGPQISALQKSIAAHLDDNARGERLRDGIQVAVIGAPNAGKSSLVNMFARRDVAIVSDMAGTTRDVIEVHLDLAGYPVIMADTAGLRPSQLGDSDHDKIESEGIKRALERAENADLKLLVFDAACDVPDADTLALYDERAIIVLNKIDQCDDVAGLKSSFPGDAVCISVQSGAGIELLLSALGEKIDGFFGLSEVPSLTRKRHRSALQSAVTSLERAMSAPLPELMAEDLRLAVRYIGSITGKVDVEDLLDVIFNDFCIGK